MLKFNFHIFEIWKFLPNKKQNQLINCLFLSLTTGFCEFLTISAALPFLSIITNSKNFLNYPVAIFLSKLIGSNDNEKLVTPIIIFFGFSIILTGVFRLLNNWIGNRISALVISNISSQLFSNVINQPYGFFPDYKLDTDELNEVKVSIESNRRQRNYKVSTDLQHHLSKFKALLAIAYNVVLITWNLSKSEIVCFFRFRDHYRQKVLVLKFR